MYFSHSPDADLSALIIVPPCSASTRCACLTRPPLVPLRPVHGRSSGDQVPLDATAGVPGSHSQRPHGQSRPTALYALHCTALRCAALRCAALRCAALPCAALRGAALNGAVKQAGNCTARHCTAHNSTVRRCCKALHSTAARQCTRWLCASVHNTAGQLAACYSTAWYAAPACY